MPLKHAKSIEEHFYKFVQTHNMFLTQATTGVVFQNTTNQANLRIGVGVSGGPDSVCLSLLLKRYQKQMGITPVVIHINHHLRGQESDRDEDFVRKLSEEQLKFEFVKYDIELKESEFKGNSLEAIAREKRYMIFKNCLKELRLHKIALAHTMNDNAETMIINILRGTGIAGASGIPPVRDYIVRPMLILSRKDVLTYLKFKKTSYVIDSTNALPDFLRNQVRDKIIPELMKLNPGFLFHMLSLAGDLREMDTFFLKAAQDTYKSLVRSETPNLIKLDLRRLLEQDTIIIKLVAQIAYKNIVGTYYNPRREHIDYIVDMLKKIGDNSIRLQMLPKGLRVYKSKEYLIFERPLVN